MVWGGISLNNKTDLNFIQGNLTAESYVEVVQNHIPPFAHEIGPDFVLMQDGARAHTSRVTTRFLEDSGIQVMDWPPRSPELNNCIEHLWHLIGRRLLNRQHQPQTLQELEDAFLEEWRVIPQETIRSMSRRCQGVVTHVTERPFSLSLSLSVSFFFT